MKILNILVIPLRAGASKQVSEILQLFINGKCSLHISGFQQKGLLLLFYFFLNIFSRKPEMALLLSAWIQMIPVPPLNEPFSVRG